jgi:hypothetical protein
MAIIVDYNRDTGVVTYDDGSTFNFATKEYTPSDTPAEPEVWKGDIDYENSDFDNGIIAYTSGITYNSTTNEFTYPDVYPDNVEYVATMPEFLEYLNTNPTLLQGVHPYTAFTLINSRYSTAYKNFLSAQNAPIVVDYFDKWQSLLSGEIEYIKDVDRRDDVFNALLDKSALAGARMYLSGDEIRNIADLPDYLSIYDDYRNTSDIITSETVSEAYWTLLSGDGPEAALSEYYGTDIKLGDTAGSNYSNINKYGDMDEEEFKQFQSIMKPILGLSVPYTMMTQGLDYNNAVEYVYTHDPMAAAVYTLYGVDLYRQTGDGSTYIYDPIQGQEIRTLEVKDPNFGDIGAELIKMAAIAVVTAGIGNAFSTMYANAGLSATSIGGSTAGAAGAAGSTTVQAGSAASIAGKATAAALMSAARGGTIGDAFKAAVMAGGSDFLANSEIVKSTLDSLQRYFLPGTSGFDISAVVNNPITQGMSYDIAGVLSGVWGAVTEGASGSDNIFCFAAPCEPGTIFVGNAFSGIGPDEIVQQVIASGTPGVSIAGAGAGITGEQFWDEFKNQWYNYKPDPDNGDPNANLPNVEILPQDPTGWEKIAFAMYSILPGTATIYDEDGNPVETNVLRAYIEGNFDAFTNEIKDKFSDTTKPENIEKLLTEAAETGNESLLMGAILATKATGSFIQWANTMGLLAKEYDRDSAMGSLGQQLIDLADAKTPEDMQAVFDSMDARLATAVQSNDPLQIAKALYGNLESAPKEFFYYYIAGELAEEGVQAMLTGATSLVESGAGKVFGTAFGAGKFKLVGEALTAVNKGLEKVFGKKYITRAVDKGLSVLEAFAGGAQDTYDQAYDIVYAKKLIELKNRNPSLTDAELEAQAADIADTVAQEYALRAGIVFTAAAGVSEAVFGNEVFERIFGRGRLGEEFSDIFQVMAIEGISELLEEGGTNIYQQVLLAELDPNREFSSGEAWASAFIGALAGTTVAGTALVGADTASIITKTLTSANRTIADVIGRAKKTLNDRGMAAASAQLAAEMDTILGNMQGAARDIVYFNVMNEVNDAGYTSTDELKDVFSKYDGTPTTEQFEDVLRVGYTEGQLNDVTDAFFGLEGFEPTYEDLLNILNGAYDGSNAQQAVLDYANPLYNSRAEVLAAAEAAGVTLTEDQINALVGRGSDADIGTQIAGLIPDPNNLSPQTVHIDYDTNTYYFSDGTTFNSDTGTFSSGEIDADGNVTYADGSVYNPDTGEITNASGVSTTATTQTTPATILTILT